MTVILLLSASVFGTSVVMHLRVRSYVIASIVACLVGPLTGCVAYYVVSGFDPEVMMWLPIMIVVMTLYSSPAPFILGLGVRLARRHYRKRRGICLECGSKGAADVTVACPNCEWLPESIRQGFCPQCGYDLRGDYSTGCPECGWRRAEKDAQQTG